jgi:hypothetical protein
VEIGQSFQGSAGCQPVGFGSLPERCVDTEFVIQNVAGKLPAIAGWQPALPKPKASSAVFPGSSAKTDYLCAADKAAIAVW